jgi:hypothetical protein
MFYPAAVSSLILLESRYVFHGFLSQPLATAFILYAAGGDPGLIFMTAATVHLLYIDKKPSGASLFPEYPFAYFGVLSSMNGLTAGTFSYFLSLILIIAVSNLTAVYIRKTRHYFERHRSSMLFSSALPNMPKALIISFAALFVYSAAVYFIARQIFRFAGYLGLDSLAFSFYPDAGIILCLLLIIRYAYINMRRKHA